MPLFGQETLQLVEDALRGFTGESALNIEGSWSQKIRRAYVRPGQMAAGPYVDVVDYRWNGQATATSPFVGIAFGLTKNDVYWVKSRPPVASFEIQILASGYADFNIDRFTVALHVGGAWTPALPVAIADPRDALAAVAGVRAFGVRVPIFCAEEAEHVTLFLPGAWVSVGRNRLWRLRDGYAQEMPEAVRALLTRGRAGRIRAPSGPR